MPRKFQRLLREWGYEADLLQEHTRANAPDSDVIQLAQSLDAALLTVDKDFSNVLHYPPQDYAGIIVIRYLLLEEDLLIATLHQALSDLYRADLRGTLVIVTPNRYRIRRW
ncbi:DUF5615 family PIN-like protein [Chloroflexota bacterium]